VSRIDRFTTVAREFAVAGHHFGPGVWRNVSRERCVEQVVVNHPFVTSQRAATNGPPQPWVPPRPARETGRGLSV
jgi:hypothetical protein